MSIEQVKAVYFIGIGGIGMSAIARYFHSKGARVSGYDKTETGLTKELEESGIHVHYEEDIEQLPKDIQLVVYTPAIPDGHKELQYYREHGYLMAKRSEVLQMITSSSFNICVSGTHGKTTISTMIAHVLRHSGYGCSAFLGGISVNYGTNFWSHEKNVFVIEADEYDRSFLKLSPDIAIISAMDPDHLDIYGTAEAMEQAFIDFSKRIKPGGKLVRNLGLKRGNELKADRQVTYSLQNKSADSYAVNIRTVDGSYRFDVMMEDTMLDNVVLHMGGLHNAENAIAAITVASSLGIGNDSIREAIEVFAGVKRRFEYIIKSKDLVFIDDYAHHPEELKALINGAKSLFPQRKCTVIFQPHLFTRTRDLADGFAEALGLADIVILLPIYPARELPINGVNSEMILNKINKKDKKVLTKDELMNWINNDYSKSINRDTGDLLITAGAGDIDMMVEPMKTIIEG